MVEDASRGRNDRAQTESTIFGHVLECYSTASSQACRGTSSPSKSGQGQPFLNLPFGVFIERHFVPNVFPTLKNSLLKGVIAAHWNIHLLPAFGDSRLCDIGTIDLQHFVLQKMEGGLSWGILGSLAQLDVQDIHDREEMELLPRAKSRLRSGVTRKACRSRKACSDSLHRSCNSWHFSKEPCSNHGFAWIADRSTGRRDSRSALEGHRFRSPASLRVEQSHAIEEPTGYSQNPRQPTHVCPYLDLFSGTLLAAARTASWAKSDLDALVFQTSKGTPLSDTNLLHRELKPAGRKIGTPWLGWHTLRRTHATLLQAAGGSLKDAQAQLGHYETINHARNLHRADSRTPAGGGRKPGAFGDEW